MRIAKVFGLSIATMGILAACSKSGGGGGSPAPTSGPNTAAANTQLPPASCSPQPPAPVTPPAPSPSGDATCAGTKTTPTALYLDGTVVTLPAPSSTPVTTLPSSGTPTTTTTTTTGTPSSSTTCVTTPSPTPSGTTVATFNPGPGLEGCEAQKLSWVPSATAAAACGDPLVSWCCSAQQALAEFPAMASQLQTAFATYQNQGEILYNCAFANSKYSFYFFGASSTGYHLGSVVLSGVTAAAPNAASCPLATSASIGLNTAASSGTPATSAQSGT